jgi:formylglycine-generating enzyme required for sulfatase activity
VAVSAPLVLPQGYINQLQAHAACANAGKRLCTEDEWARACAGSAGASYPYGEQRERGRCNDGRSTPMRRLFAGPGLYHYALMNDPRLNRLPFTLARTGRFAGCTNEVGAFDMVGNLHEWVEARDGAHGVMRGGFYADATINGRGCRYATRAHRPEYHDYSTGFRCCADLSPADTAAR